MGQANTNLKCIENQDKTPENVYYDPPKAIFVLIDPTVKLTDTIKLSLRSSLRFVAARWKLIQGGIFMVFHATANHNEGGRRLECVYDSRDRSSCFGSGLDFEEMYRSAERGMQGVQSIPLYDACMDLINLTSEKEFEKYRRVVDIFTNGIDGDGTKNKSKHSVDDLLHKLNKVPIAKWFHTHIYTATPKTPGELFYGLREAAFMDNFLMQFHSMDEDSVPKPELLKTLRPSNKYQRGLTLLINNRFTESTSDDCPPRLGAERDTEEVRVKFRELTGNDVIVHEDVATKNELKEVLDKFVQKVDEVIPDYLIVIVSSHGKYSRILLDKGEAVDYHKHLVQAFKPSSSSESLQIPQIFIIQACQKGLRVRPKAKSNVEQQSSAATEETKVSSNPSIPVPDDLLDEQGNSLQPDGQGISTGSGYRHSFFIGNATLPHTVCYRDKKSGSIFLQAICRLFHKGPKLEDLMKLVDKEMIGILKSYAEQQVPITKTADFPQDFCFSVRDAETEE